VIWLDWVEFNTPPDTVYVISEAVSDVIASVYLLCHYVCDLRFSDLSYNRINAIDGDVFIGLSNLKQL